MNKRSFKGQLVIPLEAGFRGEPDVVYSVVAEADLEQVSLFVSRTEQLDQGADQDTTVLVLGKKEMVAMISLLQAAMSNLEYDD